MQRDYRIDQTVDQMLGNLLAVEKNGVARHQQANITHEHQGAALEGELGTIRLFIGPIRIQRAGDGFAIFLQPFGEITFHEAEPVAVNGNLIFGIHGSNGILAIHDGGERRFEDDIGDAGFVEFPDRACSVDADFSV